MGRRVAPRLLTFATTCVVVTLVQVAIFGRVENPGLGFQISISALAGAVASRPKLREVGPHWGSMDQQLALKEQRRFDILKALRTGTLPADPGDRAVALGLVPVLQSDLRLARFRLHLLRALGVASCLGLVVVAIAASWESWRLISLLALTVFFPLVSQRASCQVTRKRENFDALRTSLSDDAT